MISFMMYIKKFIILLSPLRKHNRVGKELKENRLTKQTVFRILKLCDGVRYVSSFQVLE